MTPWFSAAQILPSSVGISSAAAFGLSLPQATSAEYVKVVDLVDERRINLYGSVSLILREKGTVGTAITAKKDLVDDQL